MIWILLGVLVAGEAAKLDNAYLPPPQGAKESGGSDTSLQLPLEPPYIDQYSPNTIQHQPWRPGTRAVNPPEDKPVEEDSYLENEDEIAVPATQKGRFISGSYSYTGPDNVLVTVTYKAADKKATKADSDVVEAEEETENEEEEEEEEEVEESDRSLSEEEVSDDDSVVPTPATLPSELARAFDFHKKKHSLANDGKTNRPKKPIRKIHNKKGQQNNEASTEGEQHSNAVGGHRPLHGLQHGPQHGPQHGLQHGPQQAHTSQQNTNQTPQGYHYKPAPQGLYGAPTIHQGYSYPKQS